MIEIPVLLFLRSSNATHI